MAESVQTTVLEGKMDKAATLGPSIVSPRKYHIMYIFLMFLVSLHIAAIYGLYLCFTSAKRATIILGFILIQMSSIGVTAGAHRLWAHKAYKAKLPLQILLMLMNSIAYQNSVIFWVRDHRVHHKYSDTDADPHNARRGFFYSHIGWLVVKKHPEVKRCGKDIDMSDLYNNPVLRFQKKYAVLVFGAACFGLPTLISVYFWGETWTNAWHVNMFRYVLSLHFTWLVNSLAHMWGTKPYDKNILPAQNSVVSFVAFGEGFHNYHHVFPWDYRAAELGNNSLNITTMFIDFFSWIGWAYDLKTVSNDLIKQRAARTGDGSNIWGWGDKDLSDDMKKSAISFYTEHKKDSTDSS